MNHRPITGPNSLPTALVPNRWIANSTGEHHERDRHHPRLERGRGHLEPFHRRQHRDRRCDHAVAVEQRGAEDAQRDQHRPTGPPWRQRALHERDQGHDAALALVVRAHDHRHVLDRHDDRDRPEDQRDDPVDVVLVDLDAFGEEHGLHRVQGAGADVAEHHTQSAQGQRAQPRGARLLHGDPGLRRATLRRTGLGGRRRTVVSTPVGVLPAIALTPLARSVQRSRAACAGAVSTDLRRGTGLAPVWPNAGVAQRRCGPTPVWPVASPARRRRRGIGTTRASTTPSDTQLVNCGADAQRAHPITPGRSSTSTPSIRPWTGADRGARPRTSAGGARHSILTMGWRITRAGNDVGESAARVGGHRPRSGQPGSPGVGGACVAASIRASSSRRRAWSCQTRTCRPSVRVRADV